jgi:hypothetical protein
MMRVNRGPFDVGPGCATDGQWRYLEKLCKAKLGRGQTLPDLLDALRERYKVPLKGMLDVTRHLAYLWIRDMVMMDDLEPHKDEVRG